MEKTATQTIDNNPTLKRLTTLAILMDSKFRIPGTNIRYGIDGIIGLIPIVGDLSTFVLSGFMVLTMARNGASGNVLARMVFNIVLDAVIGMVPIFGDMFDIGFKANLRNVKLMKEHYEEGRHKGGAWKIIVPLLLTAFLIIALIAWGSYVLLKAIFYH